MLRYDAARAERQDQLSNRTRSKDIVSYRVYDTAQGSFAIDWDTCCQIIRSYHRADLQLRYSAERTESQSSTVNPLSWGLPDLTFIEVDWGKVAAESQALVMSAAFKFAAIGMFQSAGMDALVRELQRMMRETRRLNADFARRMRTASDKSWKAMEGSIATYQRRIDEAKHVRDLSGSILIGASTVTTGGASAAAVGASGAVIKATAKYQDYGSAGAAALELTQNIVCTVIPGARQVPMGKVAKTIISVASDSGEALLEGEALSTAVSMGTVNIPIAAAGEAAKKGLQQVLSKTAVPIVVKVAEDRAKKVIQGHLRTTTAAATPTSMGVPTVSTPGTANRVSVADELLLKLAVVDMAKGVGHSWW